MLSNISWKTIGILQVIGFSSIVIIIVCVIALIIQHRNKTIVARYFASAKSDKFRMKISRYLERYAESAQLLYKTGFMDINKPKRCIASQPVVTMVPENPSEYVIKYFEVDTTDRCVNAYEALYKITGILSDIYSTFKKTAPHAVVKRVPREMLYSRLNLWVVPEFPLFTFECLNSHGDALCTAAAIKSAKELKLFAEFLSRENKKEKHAVRERRKMTTELRNAVKERDKYTCQICGNSTKKEPNLLLEVDHIIPVAKGGTTEMSNLQTLCWKCNRKKSDNV